MLKKVSKILVYLLIFLFPIFFLPISRDPLFYPKEIVFIFLVFLSLLFWFLDGIISKKKLILKENNFFYLALFLLFFFSGLSTLFSVFKNASFWGFPLEIGEGFLFLLFCLLFTFLILNVFENFSEIFTAFLIFFFSSLILAIVSILQIYNIFSLPFVNLSGSISSLSIFFAVSLPIFLSFYFQSKGFWKIIFGLPLLISLFLLISFGVKFSWVLIFLSTIFLLVFSLEKKKGEIDFERGIILSLFLILSIFYFFFPIRFKIFPALPVEVSLDFLAEIPILKGVFSEGIKNILLGTGPGTFIFDYSKYRPIILNQTLFWGTRFSFGASTIFDWFATKGILSALSLIFLFLLFFFFILKKILKERENLKIFEIGIFISTLISFLSLFFYSLNLFLWFYFWLFLASSFFILSKKREIDFSSVPFSRPFFFVVFFVTISFSFLLALWQFQKYLADVYYQKANQKINQDVDLAIEFFKRATKLNPQADIYWRDLSQTLLVKATQVSQNQNLSENEKRNLINQTVSDGISAINQAITVSPQNVANWNVKGFFFRNLIGVEGAGEIAVQSYQNAISLEPSSPYSLTEMARVNILMAQDFARKGMEDSKISSLSLAKMNLERAIELKSDYAPAHYLMAVVLSQEGQEKEAISKLEETIKIAPNDLGLIYQLSLLYYRTNEIEKAENLLKSALQSFPQYSNARYLLGLVYDREGQKEKALEEFKKVAELNPENEEVKKIVENLEKGLPALEGILTPKTLSEEKPTEIRP